MVTEWRTWKIALTATPGHPGLGPILWRGDIAGAFQKAAEVGCAGVELHLRRPEDVDPVVLTRLMAQYDLVVPTIGTGMAATEEGLTFADINPSVRARAVARVCSHVRLAAQIGSAVTIGLINGKIGARPDDERRIRRRQALECLKEVCHDARQHGVLILLEPLNRYECDYINTLADGVAVAREIAADNVRLLADTFHLNIEEADVLASLRTASASIGYVHLADTNREAPGHGHLDLEGVLGALSDIEYEGELAFEVLPLPDPETAIRDGISAVRSAVICTPANRKTCQQLSRTDGRPVRSGHT
jgi:sugar phosphate isomerase/epimerase